MTIMVRIVGMYVYLKIAMESGNKLERILRGKVLVIILETQLSYLPMEHLLLLVQISMIVMVIQVVMYVFFRTIIISGNKLVQVSTVNLKEILLAILYQFQKQKKMNWYWLLVDL